MAHIHAIMAHIHARVLHQWLAHHRAYVLGHQGGALIANVYVNARKVGAQLAQRFELLALQSCLAQWFAPTQVAAVVHSYVRFRPRVVMERAIGVMCVRESAHACCSMVLLNMVAWRPGKYVVDSC